SRVRATPVLGSDGTLYVGTEAGDVLAIDAQDHERFRAHVGAPVLGALALTASGDLIIAADGLYAFAPSGALRFHFVTADALRGAPALHPQGFIVAGTSHGTLLAITLDGRLRFEVDAHGAIEGGAAIADDGAIAVGNSLGELLI